jgi:hypothetical protein
MTMKSKKPGGGRHKGASFPHLRRHGISVLGKTSYQHAHRMAFPGSAASADASPLPAAPAPPMMGSGGAPDMSAGPGDTGAGGGAPAPMVGGGAPGGL